MKNLLIVAGALALAGVTAPALAQDPAAMTGMMAPSDVGVSPLTGTSATDYVKLAADGDMYEIKSSRIALSRSRRADVKSLAQQMIDDHMKTSKTLMAALRNADRTITPPSTMLSSDNAAKIALLRKTPRASFDDIYLQQQLQAHQNAWALHKGYATDGTDAPLKQVASTAVPIVERHISHIKSLTSAGMGGSQ